MSVSVAKPLLAALLLGYQGSVAVGEPTAQQMEFFEAKIRPVLAQECYECHRTEGKQKGGLILDHREALLEGGDSGPALRPGDSEGSLLLRAMRHEEADLEMPKAGAKLSDGVLDDFEKWIAMGAPDPRDEPPSAEEEGADWPATLERRKSWWSFQPITNPVVPEPGPEGWAAPIDAFVADRLATEGLHPAPSADPHLLVRRLYLTLHGLPPGVAEVDAFLGAWKKNPDVAVGTLVDELLAAPEFGERWARHWMDWFRYADSSGSEGDPAIPSAYRYRDHLIRSLNADVPYEQMIREHLAGDLLPEPRIDLASGLNESILGLGHLRMVYQGFAPTDALDEKVRFTDDQINVVSKAVLGLTVSCARCHDHKFDAISQADYYAMFGILGSTRPGLVVADAIPGAEVDRERMKTLRDEIRSALAEEWSSRTEQAGRLLLGDAFRKRAAAPKATGLPKLMAAAFEVPKDQPLAPWWERQMAAAQNRAEEGDNGNEVLWDLSDQATAAEWLLDATAPGAGWQPPGALILSPEGSVVDAILPAGVYGHLDSTKDRSVFGSPKMEVDQKGTLSLLMAGDGEALARYVVQDYPRKGTVYPVTYLKGGDWRRQNYKLDYWVGDRIHVEMTTAADSAVLARPGVERSWWALREVRFTPEGETAPRDAPEFLNPLLAEGKAPPNSLDELSGLFAEALGSALDRWGKGEATDGDAQLLDEAIRRGLLPNEPASLPTVERLLTEYRKLEAAIPVPTRAPGVLEALGRDQPLFTRGDHKQPAEAIPRRFLEAIDDTPYETTGTGRLEFAEDLFREDNPFTARVIVNRIWHHLWGSGLVLTADNFGRLGQRPSHPELLDHLAHRLRNDLGWSMKQLIREIVLSKAWQQDSVPTDRARAMDPENRLLSHYPVHRLEAEAIRDTLLKVSGRLQETRFGPSVNGNSPRRSVYVSQVRNRLDQFLGTFDAPVPHATVGRRNRTNIPAQSLAFLNSPFVTAAAKSWAQRTLANPACTTPESRVDWMFRQAFARPASAEELNDSLEFLEDLKRARQEARSVPDPRAAAEKEIAEIESRMSALTDPARARLQAERDGEVPEPAGLPQPWANWEFEGDDADADEQGRLPVELVGQARFKDGALSLEGGFAKTAALPEAMGSRSFEAVVQLADAAQKGGGVVTIQTLDGSVFDSIVYAETDAREWLAGSDHHRRTLSFQGAPDERVDQEFVHLVVTWDKEGKVRAYRNGHPYGKPIHKGSLVTYPAKGGQILLGLRHGTAPNAGRALRGRIDRAAVYDRALSEEEVAELAGATPQVTMAEVLEALPVAVRKDYEALAAEVSEARATLPEPLRVTAIGGDGDAIWTDFAHALLNLKELIYLR